MLVSNFQYYSELQLVSVAGCLGYDVLVLKIKAMNINTQVSVAGCLGYDVLVYFRYFD